MIFDKNSITKERVIYALTIIILIFIIYCYSLEPFDNAATYSNFDRIPQSKHASRSMADNISKFIICITTMIIVVFVKIWRLNYYEKNLNAYMQVR